MRLTSADIFSPYRWRWRVRRCWKATRCGGGTCSFSSLYIACFSSGRREEWSKDAGLHKLLDFTTASFWFWLFHQTQVRSLPCLVSQPLRHSMLVVRLDVTLASEDSRNLSLPYQLLSLHWNKTKAILLMLDEKKVFCSCWNKTRCQKSDSTNFLVISNHFKRNFFVHQFVYCTQCLGSIVLCACLYNNCTKSSQIWQAEKPLWWNYHSTAEVNRR